MNILFLYNSTQTYTNTIYEHLNSFARYSKNAFFFCHHDETKKFNMDLSRFDAVLLHYSVRFPYNKVSDLAANALSEYSGLKALFIQDEYDHTHQAWHWIKRLRINLVFTVVPAENIHHVYPPKEFPNVRFVTNLTGYVPEQLPVLNCMRHPSKRDLIIGYRGRNLPIRYGQLGLEKIEVGQIVKKYCESHGISHDIAWSEEARIYGHAWYEFIASCRATLCSESGSNVFDWDGTIDSRVDAFVRNNPATIDSDIYRSVIEPCEQPGLMNQISPRVFEAIILRTVLVMFEGRYSGIVVPYQHFIPLKKDGSNLDEVFKLLMDNSYVDKMTETAYKDIIASGKYSYKTFVNMVDKELDLSIALLTNKISSHFTHKNADAIAPTPITTLPLRALPMPMKNNLLLSIWHKLPAGFREWFIRRLKKMLMIENDRE